MYKLICTAIDMEVFVYIHDCMYLDDGWFIYNNVYMDLT